MVVDEEDDERVREHAREWRVDVRRLIETESSVLAFGTRGPQRVVLKVIRRPGDEWYSGEMLRAFAGKGTVRVYEYADGAVLTERLDPATSLASVSLAGRDEAATGILADVIGRMSPADPPDSADTVAGWGKGFERYLALGDDQIDRALVEHAQRVYDELAASQESTRLLHGDLQHYNVLFDNDRGWLAIDPKGVVGEVEYEAGASLRNPSERPDLFTTPAVIERRIGQYETALKLDANRMLAWGFAQAVLSAIWGVEDEFVIEPSNSSLLLAKAIVPMLPAS